jgi:hypothetical protein
MLVIINLEKLSSQIYLGACGFQGPETDGPRLRNVLSVAPRLEKSSEAV